MKRIHFTKVLSIVLALVMALSVPVFAFGLTSGDTRTVTGFTTKLIAENLDDPYLDCLSGAEKDAIVTMYDTVVELRPNYWTPSSAAMKTIAVDTATTSINGVGSFTIEDVPYGTYVLYIKRPGFLARCMTVTVSPSDPDVIELSPPGIADDGVFKLLAGDINDDGIIDVIDHDYILSEINKDILNPAFDFNTDFNFDLIVDIKDLMLLSATYGMTIMDYAGAETVNFGMLTCSVMSMLAKVAKLQQIPYTWVGFGAPVFTTSNATVCDVTQDGVLVPIKAGISVITITAPNGQQVIFAVTVSA